MYKYIYMCIYICTHHTHIIYIYIYTAILYDRSIFYYIFQGSSFRISEVLVFFCQDSVNMAYAHPSGCNQEYSHQIILAVML